MDAKLRILSERLLRKNFEELNERDRRVLRHVAEHGTVARDLSQPEAGLGARVADRVAAFGGSWSFIGIFALVLLGKCEEVWVFGSRISEGMAREMETATKRCLPIRRFTDKGEEERDV